MQMKYLLKIFFTTLLFVFSASLIFAGPRSKYGLSAAPELLIPVGSIGTALSGSNLANVTGVEALYWNPAGLSTITGKSGEVMFSHQKYIADININYAAASYKLGSLGNIGVSVKSLGFGDIEITTVDQPDGTGGTFSPSYLTIGVSFARAMTDRILFGTTAKVISERITNESATGFALDFGLQYLVGTTGLKFGVAMKNVGPSMRFDGPDLDGFYKPTGSEEGTGNEPRRVTLGDFELPTSLALALSYDLNLGKKTNSAVTFNGTFQNNSFSPDDYTLGLEYNFKKIFYLRGAYNFDQEFWEGKQARDDRLFGPSFGAGVHYNFGSVNVAFDYAYRQVRQSALSADQYFTLNVGF
jgi:long-subunit fatty acid transport protein